MRQLLNGEQLKMRDVAAIAYSAGWKDVRVLTNAVAICSSESSRYTEAENDDNPDGSVDRGLWQINSVHLGQTVAGIEVTIEALFDPELNARIAHAIWRGAGFGPWVAYTSERYLDAVPNALNGIRYWQLLAHDLPLPK